MSLPGFRWECGPALLSRGEDSLKPELTPSVRLPSRTFAAELAFIGEVDVNRGDRNRIEANRVEVGNEIQCHLGLHDRSPLQPVTRNSPIGDCASAYPQEVRSRACSSWENREQELPLASFADGEITPQLI